MSRPSSTLVTSSFGAPAALALMLESFARQHPDLDYRAAICVNGGLVNSDAWRYLCNEYPEEWNLTLKGETLEHGVSLDRLCLAVKTPYTLVVDSDVEFLASVAGDMLEEIRRGTSTAAYLPDAAPARSIAVWGRQLEVQPRVSPVLSLWRTDRLRLLLGIGRATWATAIGYNSGRYWDTGGLLLMAAEAYGPPVLPMPRLADRITHFGEVTSLWAAPGQLFPAPDLTEERRAVIEQRYETIKQRLAELRGELAEEDAC